MRALILLAALLAASCGPAPSPLSTRDVGHRDDLQHCAEECGECDLCLTPVVKPMPHVPVSADGGATWVMMDSAEGRKLLGKLGHGQHSDQDCGGR